jgi:hypothetical protein
MTAPFANVPRRCHCGQARVDTSDVLEADQRFVSVHGLYHCYAYPVNDTPRHDSTPANDRGDWSPLDCA